jgi:drug/metabolite transporter (DMT)-like permease
VQESGAAATPEQSSSSPPPVPDARLPIDRTAAFTMLALCICWGLQQVAIKVAAPSIPLLLQATLRSFTAALLLLAWAASRRLPLRVHDGTLLPGILAGAAFAGEFALIYAGLAHTTAARMIVFLYTAPCLTALGLAWFVGGEGLRVMQWAGVALAFAGIAAAFGEGAASASGTLLGDAMGFGAAMLWATTTVLIRGTSLARISAAKVLLYQLVVSAPLLWAASALLHEAPVRSWPPIAIASIAFQAVVVAFASYLAWFWLLTRYLASRLAVFSFMTPLFGVLFGVELLGEPLSPGFGLAVALVAAGIALVNVQRPPRHSERR